MFKYLQLRDFLTFLPGLRTPAVPIIILPHAHTYTHTARIHNTNNPIGCIGMMKRVRG